MILKIIIKNGKKNKNKKITVWIQKHEDFDEDIQQIFQFFKENIIISRKRRIHRYYKITSKNPAIMMSLFSTAQDLISEIYFNTEGSVEIEEYPNMNDS
ncbi:MAG: hypothetical protein ACTSRI_05325 [Promethearchaeota archaeon]